MTPDAAQAAIHSRIRSRARELGYDLTKVEPIYDGVVDWDGYLKAPLKVCWILKEPYDETDGSGNPAGGGWTMFKDFGEGDTLAKAVNRNAALRNVTYASHAILNGISSYAKLPWITDAPMAYEKTIRSIAYANISKMPGRTTTSDARLWELYSDWKEILFRQIDLYAPDVIIVCGTATLECMRQDLGLDLSKPKRTVRRGNSVVDIHEWRGRRIVWAPHPAARIPPEDWVDSVVEAAKGALQ